MTARPSPGASPAATASDAEPAAFRFRFLDSTFNVQTTSPEAAAEVARLLKASCVPPLGVSDPSWFRVVGRDDGTSCLYRGETLLSSSDSLSRIMDRLIVEVNGIAIGDFTGLAVHAGVVADGGSVIAFPGVSGAGKSTLVAACLSMGMAYVSDEALCLDFESCSVVPHPKPLSLAPITHGRDDPRTSAEPAGEIHVTAEDLRSTVAVPPLRVRDVVRIVRRPGPTSLTRAPASLAAEWLLRFAFNHYKQPQRTFRTVTDVASRARVWELHYEEAIEGAARLREVLAPS